MRLTTILCCPDPILSFDRLEEASRGLKRPKIKPISIIAPVLRYSFTRNILRLASLRLRRRHKRPLSHLRQLVSRLLHFFENNNNNDNDDCDTVKGVGEKANPPIRLSTARPEKCVPSTDKKKQTKKYRTGGSRCVCSKLKYFSTPRDCFPALSTNLIKLKLPYCCSYLPCVSTLHRVLRDSVVKPLELKYIQIRFLMSNAFYFQ